MKTFRQIIEDKEGIPKGFHRMPDGTLMKDSDHEDEVDEGLSPAAKRAARLKRKNAYLKKTMAKYGQAAKMGIPASQVNQRRNAVTRKKT